MYTGYIYACTIIMNIYRLAFLSNKPKNVFINHCRGPNHGACAGC